MSNENALGAKPVASSPHVANVMKAKTIIIAVLAFAALFASGAPKWKNLDDKSYISGPKLTEADLLGKVVLVYYCDLADHVTKDDSVNKYLPEVEKVWKLHQIKKFQVVGSYIGAKDDEKIKEAIQKNKVTFPVYYNFSLDPDPRLGNVPFYNVVNHRGVSLYGGTGVKAYTDAIAEAINAIGVPMALCEDVEFKKFKGMAGQLKLGKNLTNVIKTLEKKKSDKDPDVASEASEILSAIESAKSDVKGDIELYREADPAEAIKIIDLFMKTWPKDDSAKEYKAAVAELKKAAAERAKAAKEKAKEKVPAK